MPNFHKTAHGKVTASLLAAFAISSSFAGCAADSAQEESGAEYEATEGAALGLVLEDESNVVASFVSGDHRVVKFVEDEPGYIGVLQSGALGTEPLVSNETLEGLDPEQVYEQLSGKTAPSKLRAASKRVRERAQSPGAQNTPALRTATQEDEGAATEKGIGVSTQALFDDSWLWDNQYACWSGAPNVKRFRNSRATRDMINNEVKSAEAVVYNTDTVANVTGSFKIRPWATWSGGVGYNLAPNYWVSYRFDHINGVREFDAKTYINPHGSAYTACQTGR